MSEPVLTAQEVLKWNEKTSEHWRGFLAENPGVLAIECDIAGTKTVAELMQHIVAVELRYAERIAQVPETSYERVAHDSVEAIYATHERAMKMLRPGGRLITCSCSHHVTVGDFMEMLRGAAGDAGRRVRLLELRGAAADHPVVLNIPETEYLKCVVLEAD